MNQITPSEAPAEMAIGERDMSHSTYSLRASRWGSETIYRQTDDTLYWTSKRGDGFLQYADIDKIQIYKIRFFGSKSSYWRCVLHSISGQKICLQAAHHLTAHNIEDRSVIYIPFIKELESRVATANPKATVSSGRNLVAFADAWRGRLVVFLLNMARLFPLNGMRAISALLMRNVGPLLKGHRVARTNLRAAYPDKSLRDVDRILIGMWDNLGRLFAEYAHLDRLWDYDPDRIEPGRLLLDESSRERFIELTRTKEPKLVFGAHLANWELLLWCCGAYEGEAGIVYRPTNVGPLDRKLLEIRLRSGVSLIAGNAEAFFTAKRMLHGAGVIGMLVDEHFPRGVPVTFFGRECTVNPLLARYARQFDCAIHGGRIVRLPRGKFRLDITDSIVGPRDGSGRLDVAGTMQLVTNVIEGWIREHPEQWLWIQRRWRL